ncbi:hypothetical protein CC86DRAFT_381100 [Ophiobolus disseminans]|uniref:Uncharacterized protein n=1 Tax=Ophiobolus disseminans TaxID=1469910 RepID=A0A6A7A4C5_9PLEO|nr:hypothetical protein CC86DRAFT_381100 [Ophiobolus disseminans]
MLPDCHLPHSEASSNSTNEAIQFLAAFRLGLFGAWPNACVTQHMLDQDHDLKILRIAWDACRGGSHWVDAIATDNGRLDRETLVAVADTKSGTIRFIRRNIRTHGSKLLSPVRPYRFCRCCGAVKMTHQERPEISGRAGEHCLETCKPSNFKAPELP